MKYIKNFEFYDNVPDENELEPVTPAPNDTPATPTDRYIEEYFGSRPETISFIERIHDQKKFTPKEAENFLNQILALQNFEICTALISYLRRNHEYIKFEKGFADIYQQAIKRWHQTMYLKVSPEGQKKAIEITSKIHGINPEITYKTHGINP